MDIADIDIISADDEKEQLEKQELEAEMEAED